MSAFADTFPLALSARNLPVSSAKITLCTLSGAARGAARLVCTEMDASRATKTVDRIIVVYASDFSPGKLPFDRILPVLCSYKTTPGALMSRSLLHISVVDDLRMRQLCRGISVLTTTFRLSAHTLGGTCAISRRHSQIAHALRVARRVRTRSLCLG